jgi:23S rRNA pseudouridine1911/1915/1917 synthase
MDKFEPKIIYEDNDLLVLDKPAGIVVFDPSTALRAPSSEDKTIIDILTEKFPDLKKAGPPPRYGIIHRLDKDTSGILLIAKTPEGLIFFQKQFKNRSIKKEYIALVVGNIKDDKGIIETLIGRSPKDKRKQKAYFFGEPGYQGKREAKTEYEVIERFGGYTLVKLKPKTGRKHQIRCHLAHIGHPIAGDKLYCFKNQQAPKGLNRHFLHASHIETLTTSGEVKEFTSDLPDDLKEALNKLKPV